ncbi:ATP-binding protein [Deinococcus aquatilis]|uniref:ATP-binding protein n=1 Tax=Deinococcus aquatilis TaxID=519440 RepID=UPI000371B814|nr:DUF87 domain-containing protein [Deinococcus aquatilis]
MAGLSKSSSVFASQDPIAKMIQNPSENLVGFVVRTGYDEFTVLTNDYFREKIGGVPMNSFLLAASFDPAKYDEARDVDKEVLLLRVTDSAALPQDDAKLSSMVEHHQGHVQAQRLDIRDGLEDITQSQLQFSGLKCNVLGTFYVDHRAHLELGSDIEDFQSVSQLRVYKPTTEVLQEIVNFVSHDRQEKALADAAKSGFHGQPHPIRVGHVRYSSTRRLQVQHKYNTAEVLIHPLDFLSRRTGVFGMTRTGKSNTVKTMVAAVFESGIRNHMKIGQLIFDPNGEYANANGQDDSSSIAEVFSDNTVRYRGRVTKGFYDLRDNFYRSLINGLQTIQDGLQQQGNLSQDLHSFFGMTLEEPNSKDVSKTNRYQKSVAIYKALLYASNLQPSKIDDIVMFPMGEKVLSQVYQHSETLQEKEQEAGESHSSQAARAGRMRSVFGIPESGITLRKARELFSYVREANIALSSGAGVGIESSTKNKPWLEPHDIAMLNLIAGKNTDGRRIRATGTINAIARDYHAPNGSDNIAADIFAHLREGRIVIVDLSVGIPSVRIDRANQIAQYVFTECQRLFNENPAQPPRIVMYIEEAHNLISKDAEPNDTWPRIAKEGAKAGIALVYATQEPSAISSNVLANTENMFVTHLNNDDELRTIAKYYDFKDFTPSIKKAQDVGFARMKTLSTPFVVPVQIERFSPEALKKHFATLGRFPGFTSVPEVPEIVEEEWAPEPEEGEED